jgi:hexosaminidase
MRVEGTGVHPALSVFAVQAGVKLAEDGKNAAVSLSTQGNAGEIHYTLNGTAVTADSPVFKSSFEVKFPTTLRARAFSGNIGLGEPITQQLSLSAALARDSRELEPCNGGAGIQLEQDPPRIQARPVFRVVYSRPCWIYRNADMTRFHALTLSVGSIPYVFHDPNRDMAAPSTAPTTSARITVHAGTCNGQQLASIPLEPAYRKDGAITLPPVSFTPLQGTQDLCFKVEDSDPATVWLLHTIQPIPQM